MRFREQKSEISSSGYREEEDNMRPQWEPSESKQEQTSSTYGRYEGDQEYSRLHNETSYETPLREEPEGKVFPPLIDKIFRQFLLVFVISMVILFAFAILCLVVVGGTPGWISFIAISFTIICIDLAFFSALSYATKGGK
jgi:hypothetical protein